MPVGEDVVMDLQRAISAYERHNKASLIKLHRLHVLPRVPCQKNQVQLSNLVVNGLVNFSSLRSVNEAFLNLVKSYYWTLIRDGEFVEGTNHAEILLNSVSFAFGQSKVGLTDFRHLLEDMLSVEEISELEMQEFQDIVPTGPEVDLKCDDPFADMSCAEDIVQGRTSNVQRLDSFNSQRVKSFFEKRRPESDLEHGNLFGRIAGSWPFQSVVMGAIVLNLLHIIIEDAIRNEQNDNNIVWLVLESVFTTVFLLEFLIKLSALGLLYFFDAWNVFDFILVGMGISGLVLEVITRSSESVASFSSEARLIRVNKVFRVMRILRAMRLVRFIQVMRARLLHQDLSLELVEQLRSITLLTTFARAHMYAQGRFLKLFGANERCQSAEEARCIIESQTAVYKAITMAASEAEKVDPAVLKGVTMLHESNRVAEILSAFIVHAHEDGVISAREAESILHPLRDHRRLWTKHLQQSHSGVHKDVDLTSEIPSESARGEKGERDEVEKSLEAWCVGSQRPTGLLQVAPSSIGTGHEGPLIRQHSENLQMSTPTLPGTLQLDTHPAREVCRSLTEPPLSPLLLVTPK
jgi:hypothetical protein